MKMLKREYWWCFLLLFLSGGTGTILLGALLDAFDENSWYAKWYFWLIGMILILPFAVMIIALYIEILSNVSAKLKINGSEYYLSPYIWIILFIVPIIGWIFLFILILYLMINILIKLYSGAGEAYIK